jgi:MFS family permease
MQQINQVSPARNFFFLLAPVGVFDGFGTCLAYVLTQAHIGAASVAALIALMHTATIFKVGFAPVVDLSLSGKRWYFIGVVGLSVSLLLLSIGAGHGLTLPSLSLLAFVGGVFKCLLAMATSNLLAHHVADQEKGRAGSWSQAGYLGAMGLSGGLVLWLVTDFAFDMVFCTLGLSVLACLCSWPIWRLRAMARSNGRQIFSRLRALQLDLLSLLKDRPSLLFMGFCVLPWGTGAAASLLPVLAHEWHTPAAIVALVSGALSGVISVFGCLLVNLYIDRVNRTLFWVVANLLMALMAAMMDLFPHQTSSFVIFALIFALINGLVYGSFAAAVYENIGKGAAATKYSLMASLVHIPMVLGTALGGLIYERYGSSALLWTDFVLAIPFMLIAWPAARWAYRIKAPVGMVS